MVGERSRMRRKVVGMEWCGSSGHTLTSAGSSKWTSLAVSLTPVSIVVIGSRPPMRYSTVLRRLSLAHAKSLELILTAARRLYRTVEWGSKTDMEKDRKRQEFEAQQSRQKTGRNEIWGGE